MLLCLSGPKRYPPGAWGFFFASAARAPALHVLRLGLASRTRSQKACKKPTQLFRE